MAYKVLKLVWGTGTGGTLITVLIALSQTPSAVTRASSSTLLQVLGYNGLRPCPRESGEERRPFDARLDSAASRLRRLRRGWSRRRRDPGAVRPVQAQVDRQTAGKLTRRRTLESQQQRQQLDLEGQLLRQYNDQEHQRAMLAQAATFEGPQRHGRDGRTCCGLAELRDDLVAWGRCRFVPEQSSWPPCTTSLPQAGRRPSRDRVNPIRRGSSGRRPGSCPVTSVTSTTPSTLRGSSPARRWPRCWDGRVSSTRWSRSSTSRLGPPDPALGQEWQNNWESLVQTDR